MLYLKPVQTGFPDDSDGEHVAHVAGGRHRLGLHAAQIYTDGAGTHAEGLTTGTIDCCTLFAWQRAVSPHLAVETEGRHAADATVLEAIKAELDASEAAGCEFRLVETAGGVASPAPSGTLQCDLLAPLGLPALLVGDGGLGGISATICAYEALRARRMEVSAVALLDGGLDNHVALCKHIGSPVITLPPISADQRLADWLHESTAPLENLLQVITQPERVGM